MNTSLTVQQQMDVMQLGSVLSQSGYFQDAKEAAQAVVKVLAGSELGFGPIASMTGINIIKGKVSLSANLIAAAIKRSGRYTFRLAKGHPTDTECQIEFFELFNEKWNSLGVSAFTIQDAQKANLMSNTNWKNYPRNMLFARALSNGAKWYCPDIFGGPIYTPDELGADEGVDGEVITVEVPQQPKPQNGKPEQKTNGKPAPQPPRVDEEKPYKFPSNAAETFWKQVQGSTENYYKNPFHLVEVLGGQWFNFGDQDLWGQKLDYAISHAQERWETQQEMELGKPQGGAAYGENS